MGRTKRAAATKAKEAIETHSAKAGPSKKKAKAGLAVGDDLPEFELETDEETTITSSELVKENGIVLFAYPKANTAGCTNQAKGLSEKAEELAAAGYKVYGISADKPKSQANWRKKEGLAFNLLCDPSYETLAKLGFTKGPKSINRSHIVVAKGGKVLDVQYGVKPKDSVKDAVAFCLEHQADPLPAAEAEAEGEEAAAAGEEAEKQEEAAEKEEPAAEEDKAAQEPAAAAAEQPSADDKEQGEGAAGGSEAAAMDVDAPVAAEEEEEKVEEAPAAEAEQTKEPEKEEEQAAAEPEPAAEEPAAAAEAPEAEATAKQEPAPVTAEDAPAEPEEAAAAEAAAPQEPREPADAPAAAAEEAAA